MGSEDHPTDTSWLCADCTARLEFAHSTIAKIDRSKIRYGYYNEPPTSIVHEETISIGAERTVPERLDYLRKLKVQDWKYRYCIVCVRLSIDLRRAILRKYKPLDSDYGQLVWEVIVYQDSWCCAGKISAYLTIEKGDWRTEVTHLSILESCVNPPLSSIWNRMDSIDLTASKALDECLLSGSPDASQPSNDGVVLQLSRCERCAANRLSDNHINCQSKLANPQPWLPDRLLQLCDESESVHLIRTSRGLVDPNLAYVTLSHCWGNPTNRLLLTKQTETAFMAGLPVSRLAKTFRDAIGITAGLGYRYMWIDSLCILQDCATDWSAQSAVMGKIYANSSLNIAALEAVDDDEGILPINDSRVVRGFTMVPAPVASCESVSETSIRYLVWPNVDLRFGHGCGCGESDEVYSQFNLPHRGWVYQERELAARTLLIDDLRTRWTCRSQKSNGWPRFFESLSDRTWIDWTRIVEAYSLTELTYATDRVVAIAAIAERFAHRNEWHYYAGLFEERFVSQLAWGLPKEKRWHQNSAPPLDQYLAPTWSWASVNRYVSYYEPADHQVELAELSSAEAELIDVHSPFGQVQAGRILLFCELLPVSNTFLYDGKLKCFIRIEGIYQMMDCMLDTAHAYERMKAANLNTEKYAIPLVVNKQRNWEHVLELRCLIVERVLNTQAFRRLGICFVEIFHHPDRSNNHGTWNFLEDFSDTFKAKYFPMSQDFPENSDVWRDLAVEVQERLKAKGVLITLI